MKRLTVRDEKSGAAYFPGCYEVCDGRCKKCDRETNYCETLASYEDTGLSPKQVAQLHKDCQRWKTEARKQAAAAGELKLALSRRLEEIQRRKASMEDLVQNAETDMDRVIAHWITHWKVRQLTEEEQWLEELLQVDARRAAGQYAEDGADQPVLMPAI